MGWPLKEGDFVEIKNGVFPDKIGRIGRVTSVRPTWKHPYEINVDGAVSQFTRAELSDPIPVDKLVRRLNNALGRIAELESDQEPQEDAALKM